MTNPFDVIESRLSNIENLLLDIKHPVHQENQGNPKFNVDETAEYLGVTTPTVYSKNSRGELPGCKAPGSKRLFFFKSDLDAYLRQGRKKTNAEIEAEASEFLVKRKG